MRANERENERELQLIRAASQIFFFFFLFSLRGAVPAPPWESSAGKKCEKKIFCATRLVPAPKVHRESRGKKIFRASRLVPAPKVHRESEKKKFSRYAPRARAQGSQGKRKKFFFGATRLVPAPKVHRENKEKKMPASRLVLRASAPMISVTVKR